MKCFIVLGHGRSGSTLLVRSLTEHPNVRMFGELFHDTPEERERAFHALNKKFGPGRHETSFYREGEDGGAFLRDSVFYKRPWSEIMAVGFKMFYLHARGNGNVAKAWDYLAENKDIHVVHLRRANLLECWLSLKIASITKEWAWQKGAPGPRTVLPPLELDPIECENYCNQTLMHRQWASERFKDHPTIEIEYETDLVSRFQETMYELHDFLGIPRGPAEQILEKMGKRKPREQIVNYDEFKEHFRNTLYESFFE
jgi:LPS sulfotransferase NodH